MKKRRTRLRGTKTAAKSEQKKLLGRIKKLKENPKLLLPKIKGNGIAKEVYGRVNDDLLLAKDQYINPPSFMTNIFGPKPKDMLAKAYYASLSILDSGAPVMAMARFPHGEVNYVMRGSGVSKEKLIGIQNYHHRLWSRFAHLDYVKKYKLYIYSLEKGLVCTGISPDYPKELWSESCNLLKVKENQDIKEGLIVRCQSINKEIIIPYKRVLKSKNNSYSIFLKHQITYDPDLDFKIDVITPLSSLVREIPEEILEDYKKGRDNDSDLLNNVIKHQKNLIEGMEGQHFVIANKLFNRDLFMNKLSQNKIDEAIMEDILSDYHESVILDNVTPAIFTEHTWASAGKNLAEKLAPTSSEDYNGENSLEILRKLYNKVVKESLTEKFPKFKALDEPLEILNASIRLLKAGDRNKAVNMVDNSSSNNNMTKSISWSILKCLGAVSSRGWQYSKEEQSLGSDLQDLVQKLIDSEPEDYLETFKQISLKIGLGDKLEVI